MGIHIQDAPGVAQVLMQYTQQNQNLANVYNVYKGSPTAWGEPALQALGAVFNTWEDEVASGERVSQVVHTGCIVTDLTSLDASRVTVPQSPPVPGNIGTDGLPNNSTLAIKASTGKRGRGLQGRIFWIGMADVAATGSTVSTTAADLIVSALEQLIGLIHAEDAAYDLVVLHRMVDGIIMPIATHDVILNYHYTDLSMDSQVNRLPNHKKHKRRSTP